ncbi:hypothetical protein N0V93_010172 [Gnomoniopsis smithogilvyi]|uniref:HMA domain-containing protein n=1 Tax=Gnomoniopsis smithogilvyi TaxID=1191159 RepID=A0A9W8YIF5_9PEZI|nr:hypothetical protein N0V93_010172 [Gnomoniopsis smithogilvyi]
MSKEQSCDLEAGLAGKEHVILSISGMTCTGCETKLQRTLASLESVKNLKTSLILSRAEFDVDLSSGNTDDVVKHLTRTTEFKCERVSNNKGSSIDVNTTGMTQEIMDMPWPLGVLEMTLVDKDTINIAFDDKIIGARDLLKKGWGRPLQLAPPRADSTLDAGSKHVRHIGYTTVLSAILTIPVLVMAWAPIPKRELAYGSASLVLATLVQLFIAGPFHITALKSLVFSRVIEMDLLVVLSTCTAYIYSVVSFGYLVAGRPLSTGEFFETSTLLVTLIVLGRYVAAHSRQKAVESVSIRSLQASTATLVEETGEREIDVRLLQHGDVFEILPDSKIATDGTVISGSSEVDESMVTGESRPIEKYKGSAVIAGSVNGAGMLNARVDRTPGDNTISAIANMVDEAKLSKPKLQELADHVASYFVPVVIGLTVITFCVWVAVGRAVQHKSGSDAVIQAITFSITVLIVSCPCAIGLAVPMVIVIASGVAAERGVIIKDASTIEVAHKTNHVVFDKTGTLTEGRLTVTREVYFESEASVAQTQALLLKLLASNKHPVSTALTSKLVESGVKPASEVHEIKALVGKGVEAVTSSGLILRAGNRWWLNVSDADVESVSCEGYTTSCFTINDSLAAVFGLQDTLREDAVPTVTELQERGVVLHVLSGDDDSAVRALTSRLNIPEDHIRTRCTPADKQAYIQNLQSSLKGPFPPTIIFCGDGTNDAVALAQATVGIHMNTASGTDVASSAADVVLMRPCLAGILTLIDVSKKSVHRIRFNFGWSATYNLFAILLGGGAFSAIGKGLVRIPPAFAGLGELASVLPVVAAAVLMRWERV